MAPATRGLTLSLIDKAVVTLGGVFGHVFSTNSSSFGMGHALCCFSCRDTMHLSLYFGLHIRDKVSTLLMHYKNCFFFSFYRIIFLISLYPYYYNPLSGGPSLWGCFHSNSCLFSHLGGRFTAASSLHPSLSLSQSLMFYFIFFLPGDKVYQVNFHFTLDSLLGPI